MAAFTAYRNRSRILAVIALLVGFLVLPSWAQDSRGTILGHVSDPSGAALPAYVENLDLGIGKNFLITEHPNLQYRLEILNLASKWHSTPRIPDNNLGDPNFGSLAGVNPTCGAGGACALSDSKWADFNLWTPRTLQMSLVYSF